ncbi:MAG: aldehyde dehydrogenase, partial [Acidimicrobiales bacterium]|nr:aldehyde dehydrogenase [Acidimicrobiales bacterium]
MTEFAIPHFRMRIDGRDVDADGAFTILNPKDEQPVATVARGETDHADLAVAAARHTFETGVWSSRTPADRSAVMLRIGERFNELLDEFVELEMMANGATVRQATGFHIGYAAFHWNYFAELAATYPFEKPAALQQWPTLAQSYLRREPIGVCAAITPWNFPLLLSMWKFAPALAAGNSVVVKPDEKTPLTMLRFAQLAEECGLPPGVLNVVTGEGETVGAHLAAHPGVDKVAFTGSTPVGRAVMRLGADTVKRVTLELGGKSPVVVLDDADIETAVDAALFSCFLYSGQVCESGTRLLLPDTLHDEFVARLVARAAQIKIGDPADFDTDMGPVVSREQLDRVRSYIAIGQGEGATLAFGGGTPTGDGFDRGYWVEPTIFVDVKNDMRIAQEEIFGPVLSVIRYTDDDEAVAIANDTDYGLAAAVWSGDNERALDVARRIRAGTVWINDHHMISCQVAFGGYKQSGVGRELGPQALDAYTETKHIHLDLSGRIDRRVYDALLS